MESHTVIKNRVSKIAPFLSKIAPVYGTTFSSEFICFYSDILFQSLFCPEKKNVEKLGLPSSFQLLSEIGEATSGILDRQVPQMLVICHLFLNGLLKCAVQCTRIGVNCN